MQNNLDFSVFKTGSTVYKCQHMPWKYGGACFVCVFFRGFVFWLFVFVFFSCLVQNTKYVLRYVYK